MTATLTDDLTGAAGPITGRVAATGQTWTDNNDSAYLDGSGRLIRNPAHDSPYQVGPGVYPDISLSENVRRQEAVISWLDVSGNNTGSDVIQKNGTVTLICAADPTRAGAPPDQHIYSTCVHVSFGPWITSAFCFTDGVRDDSTVLTWKYPSRLAVDGTTYTIGLYFDGARLGLKLPDRATYVFAVHAKFATHPGAHMIFQSYNTIAPLLRPRIESVAASSAAKSFGPPTLRPRLGLAMPRLS